LGRLVLAGKIESLEEIYRFSIPIKEHQIIDHLYAKQAKDDGLNEEEGSKLKEEVMKIMPVQKQTRAGQRTRFKAFIVIGDGDGHIGLGVKVAVDVQGAIKGGIKDAKLNLIPVRRGYYQNQIGNPHTIPNKVTGKGGSVRIRLIPAPRGTGLVLAKASKKMLSMAGIQDCYSKSTGQTRTRGNFLKATYDALSQTYPYLTPEFWGTCVTDDHPFVIYSDLLISRREDKYERRGRGE